MRTIPQRWSAVFKPWRAQFKRTDGVMHPPVPDSIWDWVHVNLGLESSKRDWRENVLRCRETLEVLWIVAIVEHASKEEDSESSSESPASLDGNSSCSSAVLACHGVSRRYLIHSYQRDCGKDVDSVDVFRAFFFAFDENSLRDEFRRALNEIYSQLTPEMQQTVEKHRRIPPNFFISAGQNASAAFLASVMDPCTLEYGAAAVLTELIALGVEINEEISVGSCSALGRLPISKLGPVMHAITDVSLLRASEGYEQILRRGQWTELSLKEWGSDGAWHARLLEAVCSSLAVCKDFKKVHLSRFDIRTESSHKSRRKILQWLAYALFSKDSTHSITSLTVSIAELLDGDALAMLAVLVAKNPAKELLDGDSFLRNDEDAGAQDEDPGFACLKAGTTITTKPLDDEEQLGSDPESLVLKQDGVVRVMRNDKDTEWIDIVVPHYGYCVVPRVSIDRFVPATSNGKSASAGGSGSITSLTVTNSNHQVLIPLINFISPPLLEATIQHSEVITSDFLCQFLAACPHLERIKLGDTETTSVSVFMEAYESGHCEVACLTLFELVDDHSESIVGLARMLQDPDSAAAKNLRYLTLRARSETYERFDERVFEALAEMLQVNRTIAYLEIDMCESLVEEHKAVLKRTNGQRVADLPLEPAC